MIVAEARTWLGTPYRHQGSRKGIGCDCLGLVRGVWRALYGEEPEAVPAYTADWAEAGGEETMLEAARRHCREIAIADAQAGDILVFRWRDGVAAKHCGIVTGPETMIHAYDAAGKVCEGNLAEAWRRRVAGAFGWSPKRKACQ